MKKEYSKYYNIRGLRDGREVNFKDIPDVARRLDVMVNSVYAALRYNKTIRGWEIIADIKTYDLN